MSLNSVLRTLAGNPAPKSLRQDLMHSRAPDIILRRAVVGASVAGLAAMTVASLYQTGMVKRLPDPPQKDFDSGKVNASREAYSYGTPDGPLSIVSHAVNIAVATLGGRRRAEQAPWLSVGASLFALPAALTAARYLFYQMPVKERRWCGYCVADALSHIATFGFTLYETRRSVPALLRWLHAVPPSYRYH